ncbi:glutathione S-transferase family protein [Roseixanthobacter glucoisosaccharinicivorans]|uniref:glutathione S-transferase family protein n=1 Tax=Roseixanthobacter glucoisosaccharinicivorans TaxID=3119923 RepID=UPI003727C160
MSKLTLVSHALCPFVQRAAIVLGEKDVPFERINIDLADKPDWFLALSPMGKVPVLKVARDDGRMAVLFESMVICEYLEESQSGPRLHPLDPLDRARHRSWIEFISSMLSEAWGFLNAKDDDTASSKGSALRDRLERLEGELGDGPFFEGTNFSMVDAVTAPVFRYFDVLDQSVGEAFFAGLPRMSAWRSALAVRPSVIAAVGSDYGERFQAHLARQGALLAA